MNDAVEVYSHSGSVGPGGVLALVVGIVASLILAVVYAYISVYSPIAGYVSILFVVGYGAGVGFSVAATVKVCKVRSVAFARLTGAVVGVFALYAAWATFCSVLIGRMAEDGESVGLFAFLLEPQGLWELIGLLAETGWYSIGSGSEPLSGIVLWIFWAIEAAMVIGFPVLVGASLIEDEVFCEECKSWAVAGEPVATAVPDDDVAEAMVQGDLDALERLEPERGEPAFMMIETRSCPSCDLSNSYKLSLVLLEPTKEGGVNRNTTALTPHLLVVPQDFQRVLAVPHPLPEGPAEENLAQEPEDSEQAEA